MAEMVVQKRDLGPRPAYLAGYTPSDADYSKFEVPAGAPIAVLSIDEKKWTIKYKGIPDGKITLLRDGVPVPFVDVIIIDANPHITKAFYKEGFDRKKPAQRPDCASLDGVVPLAGVPDQQSLTCKTCKWDQFGTARVGGGKGCQDNKRIAVVPASIPENPNFGGPMLLKLPPTSFVKFAEYIEKCRRSHCLPHEIVTRLSFADDQQYQVVLLDPMQFASAETVAIAKKWIDDPHTARVLQSLPEAEEYAGETPTTSSTTSEPVAPVQTTETSAVAAETAARVAATVSANGGADPFATAIPTTTATVNNDPFSSSVSPVSAVAPDVASTPIPVMDTLTAKRAAIEAEKARRTAAMEAELAELEKLDAAEAALTNGPVTVAEPTVPDTLGTSEDVLAMIDAEVGGGASIPE